MVSRIGQWIVLCSGGEGAGLVTRSSTAGDFYYARRPIEENGKDDRYGEKLASWAAGYRLGTGIPDVTAIGARDWEIL